MDISLMLALAEAVATAGQGDIVVGQAYIVLNTTALIAAAFWLGVQWNTIRTSKQAIERLEKKIDLPVAPLAEMKVALDNLKDDVEQLTNSMERFQRSIFMEAMRIGRSNAEDDARS